MNILKSLSIRTRLLIIIAGCSLALVVMGLAGILFETKFKALDPAGSQELFREAMATTAGLLAFFIVCGAGLGVLIFLSIDSSLQQITRRMQDLAEGEGDLSRRITVEGADELSRLSAFINTFIQKAQATVSQSVAAADETAQSSHELSGISRELAENVSSQCQLA